MRVRIIKQAVFDAGTDKVFINVGDEGIVRGFTHGSAIIQFGNKLKKVGLTYFEVID